VDDRKHNEMPSIKLKVINITFFGDFCYEIMVNAGTFRRKCKTYIKFNLIFTCNKNGTLVLRNDRYRLPPIPHLLDITSLLSEVKCAEGRTLPSKMVSFESQKVPKRPSHNIVRTKLVTL
jgi:hypothetical protein